MSLQQTENYFFSQDELLSYKKSGYLIREGVFSSQEIDQLLISVERAIESIKKLVPVGETYFLDGNRFVDIGSTTIQYEHFESWNGNLPIQQGSVRVETLPKCDLCNF